LVKQAESKAMPLSVILLVSITLVAGQTPAESAKPEFSAADVVSAANYVSGSVSPGQVVIVRASNAGPEQLTESHLDGEARMSTETGDTRVLFDGLPAPILYAVRGKISVVVPYGIAAREHVSLVVEYGGLRSEPVMLPVVPAAPALYTLDASGLGQAAMLNETGCCNSARNPATQGSIAQIFATGAGQVKPGGVDGLYSDYSRQPDYPKPELPVSVTVGGIPAELLYAGEASLHVSGTFVVNFRVPRNAPTGDAVPIVLTVGSYRSPDGVTMAIRPVAARVLIITGDPAIGDALERALRKSGAEVRSAKDGAQAVLAAREQDPDLIVGEIAGNEEAIQKIRLARPQVKIAAILAVADAKNLRAADLLDAQVVFVKPAASERIAAQCIRLLAARAFP
jgi:uncharacterized protein (TIGR03437 family)